MKGFLVFAVLLLCFYTPAYAVELDTSAVEQALPDSAAEILGGLGVSDISADGIVSSLWNYLRGHVKAELAAVLRPVGATIAAAMLCSVGESMQIKKEIDYVNLAGCLVIALAAVGDVNSVAVMGREAISDIHDFSKVLLPTLCSAAAAAGAVGSAAAKYAATAMFLDILISLTSRLLLPLIGAYTAALVASAATGDGRLKGPVKLLKWLSKTAMTAMVALFSSYIGLTGLTASGADAAAAKTAKAFLSSVVPVVGKVVAGASESLAAGAGLIRGAVGVFGLAAVLAVCAAPFLAIGLRYLLFKAAAAVVGLIAGERIGNLVEGIGSAYGMVLGLVGTAAVFMFVSITSLIRTVV